jgi:hypothetical protein
MKFMKSKKAIALLATIAVVAIAAVGAYAYWTASGAGDGTAAVGTVTSGITVNQTNAAITGMYPGDAAQALSGDFSNSNSGPTFVTSVTASLQSVSGGGTDSTKPACTVADFQLNDPTTTVDQDIAPGAANGSWSGPTVQLLDRQDTNPHPLHEQLATRLGRGAGIASVRPSTRFAGASCRPGGSELTRHGDLQNIELRN